ncbi:hypothetical protein [Paraburkholderia sp. EG304]|uniref:hypothetical protein n=1 Tax=Paraburkholderia sp. EG304 TaxID=3237015 RepID=UPI00397ABD41
MTDTQTDFDFLPLQVIGKTANGKNRHPNKNAGWVRRKYFRSVRFRHWVFGTETGKTPGSGVVRIESVTVATINASLHDLLTR